jgi:hypothetical protein
MLRREDVIEGMRVRVLPHEDKILSTSDFAGQEGIVTEHGLGYIYPRIRFDRKIRGQRSWFVPCDDLEALFTEPKWEV